MPMALHHLRLLSKPISLTPQPSLLSISFSPCSSLNFLPIKPTLKFPSLTTTSFCTSTSEAEPAAADTSPETEPEALKNRLIVQNIPWDCSADDVKALFEKQGTVVDVQLSMHNKARNRGLAFVTMSSEEEALTALNNLKSSEFMGRTIRVAYAKSPKDKKHPQWQPEERTRHAVFVGNLSNSVKPKDLREFFAPELQAVSSQIIYHSKPFRRTAGYGFVSFGTKEEAELAISKFNGKELKGRTVNLGVASEKNSKENEEINNESIENETNISQENIVNV